MTDERDALAALSRSFGADPAFTRAGGGNSSVKLDGLLHIKPSGVAMATLAAADLIALDRAALLDFLEHGDRDAGSAGAAAPTGSDPVMAAARAARRSPDDGRRPSVEILFHALIPYRHVLHLHPTRVNALTCTIDGERIARELFGDDALWIPYTDPGLPLARRIRDELAAHAARTGRRAPATCLLQSHGLIVAADTTDEVAATTRLVDARIAERIAASTPPGRDRVERLDPLTARELASVLVPALADRLAGGGERPVVRLEDGELALVAAGSDLGRRVAAGGALTPDQIVYAGSFPLLLDDRAGGGRTGTGAPAIDPASAGIDPARLDAVLDDVLAVRSAAGLEPPLVVLVPGLGLLSRGTTDRDAATAANLYLDGLRVALGAARLGGIRFLTASEREFIERWEAEAYRKQVAASANRPA